MDNYEYSELLKALSNKISNIASIIKPDEIKARLDEIASLESDPAFWSDVETSAKIGKEKSKISKILENFNEAKSALNDASELFELANAENDAQTINALFDDSKGLEDKVTSLEISMMLSGENDDKTQLSLSTQELVAQRAMTGRACFIVCICAFASERAIR